ncbi:MAG: NYN domain-containing protein [Bacteroidetes bacterium]|nr:NYN domain-containing protein [Bacteroidota bacterium]MBU1718530.1 NYN domain-containing protein [Bacteroidota bacterium]
MQLSKALFWDTEYDKIDFEKNARSVIERVISRGTLDDWFAIKKYYGDERLKQEIIEIRYLDKITLNFCSKYFQLPKTSFRCFTINQSPRQLWNF